MGKRQREPKAGVPIVAEGAVVAAEEDEEVITSSLSVMSSAAPSAHAIGITSMALNPKEDRLVVAREDGSIALAKVLPYSGRVMASFVPLGRTGSFEGHTITKIIYALEGSVIIASYLSGQLVIYDEATLTILHVAERFGGSIWDMTSLRGDAEEVELLCACADGSWYHFQLVRKQGKFQLSLVQVLPKIVAAHRALAVTVCGKLIVGSDDCGNIVAWPISDKGSRSGGHKWLTRLPKGGYAKSIAYDAETDFVVVGTSLGDVAFISAEKGEIVSLYTNHQGPITSVITAGPRTVLAIGWHESLRSYRFVEGKWIPAEVRRRTFYHEATQLLHYTKSNVLFGASRDGTVLVSSITTNFSNAPKYVQVCPQRYCFASAASVVITAAGNRVELYQGNDSMTHWAPLAVYAARGDHGVQGLWCDKQLTKLYVATTTRFIVLKVTRQSTTTLTMSKIIEAPYANVHSVVINGNDCYVAHGMGKLTHLAFSESGNGVIESHIELPIKVTSVGTIDEGKALLVASAVDGTATMKVVLNEDGSFAAQAAEVIGEFRADIIFDSVGLAMYQRRFFDITAPREGGTDFSYLTTTLPVDTVFFAKTFTNNGRPLWTGFSTRGLLFSTRKTWWTADDTRRQQKPAMDVNVDDLNRSTSVALSGPRTTFVVGFDAENEEFENRILVLRRDIASEVETLPLMWKVRRFAN